MCEWIRAKLTDSVFLPYQLGQYGRARQRPPKFHAQDIVAQCPCGSSIAVYEWMNVIQAPQTIGREHNGISITPCVIHLIDEVTHKTFYLIMVGRRILDIAVRLDNHLITPLYSPASA